MSKLERMETRRIFTDGRYDEIYHAATDALKDFEFEDVEEFLSDTIGLDKVLADYARRKREE